MPSSPPPPCAVRASRPAATLALLAALAGLLASGALALRAWFTAPVAEGLPAARSPAGPPPPFLLAVVDGVREDAFRDGPETAMPFVASLMRGGASGVALAGDPTMSGPCIRTLLSGRAPDLFTAFRNIRALPAEGNLVAAMVRRGARAAHAGDVVVPNLAGPVYAASDVLDLSGRTFTGVGDLDDLAFPFALEKARDPGILALTYHLVTADLTGHKSGAVGPEYAAALRLLDQRVRDVVLAFVKNHPDATILVAADHGLSAWGSHGSGEPEARRAPFVLTGPRVARVRGVEIPQAALAPTVAALLGLPQPPLAEAPPEPSLTTLSAAEAASAIDEHVRARIEVARRVGAADLAEAIEARRAKAWLERARGGAGAASAAVLAGLSGALSDRALSPSTGLLGAAAVALSAALVVFLALSAGALGGRGARATAALSACVAIPVLAGAGVALEDVFVAAPDLSVPTLRAVAALLAGLLLCGALSSRRGLIARAKALAVAEPALLVALGGALLGFLLTVRLGIDRVVHTPILVASLALLAFLAVVLSRPARERAPRARWLALGLLALPLLGSRLAEALWTDDWPTSDAGKSLAWTLVPAAAALALLLDAFFARRRGDLARARSSAASLALVAAYAALAGSSFAEAASFACLAAAARTSAEVPGPRSRAGVALLALLLLLVRGSAFHALGRVESLYTINLGGHLIPGAAAAAGGAAPARLELADVGAGLSLLAREALVWAALVLAAARSLSLSGSRDGLRRLASDLALALAARGAAVVAGLWVWWRWAWWVAAAFPVFALAAMDTLLVLVAFALAGGLRGAGGPRGTPSMRPAESRVAAVARP